MSFRARNIDKKCKHVKFPHSNTASTPLEQNKINECLKVIPHIYKALWENYKISKMQIFHLYEVPSHKGKLAVWIWQNWCLCSNIGTVKTQQSVAERWKLTKCGTNNMTSFKSDFWNWGRKKKTAVVGKPLSWSDYPTHNSQEGNWA
jgi:uncharacterized protein Usg